MAPGLAPQRLSSSTKITNRLSSGTLYGWNSNCCAKTGAVSRDEKKQSRYFMLISNRVSLQS